MADDEQHERIAAAIHRHCGPRAELREIAPLGGGASASMLRLGLRLDDADVSLVLRRAAVSEAFALNVGKRTEAEVQETARRHGVPAARVAFVLTEEDGLGEGYAMECLAGETQPARILAHAELRERLATSVGTVLAGLHAVPVDALPTLPSHSPAEQLRELRRTYDSFDHPSPVFEVAFRRLEQSLPVERTPTLVHGDFRTGNLLVDPEGIAAVLDWELCHLGDPIEDLGFLCVTSWRFGRIADRVGGFGSVAALRDAYVKAGGRPFEDAELHFWETYGTLRWGVICLYQVFAHLRGAIRSIERAAIGRRVSEVELDLLRLLS